jgi:outer membrane lipoprotein-sorting protein
MARSKVRHRHIKTNEKLVDNDAHNSENPYNSGGFLYWFYPRTIIHSHWYYAVRHRDLQEANCQTVQGTGSMKNMEKMKKSIIPKACFIAVSLLSRLSFGQQDGEEILKKVEKNMSSDNRVFESSMIIHGTRTSRKITSKTYSEGDKQSFTEYLSPAREQGTKMLKLEKQLWIYSPSTDRTIQISGHMLRQSVMGSDLSYEDMMDDRKLTDVYSSKVIGNQVIDDRKTIMLVLTAKVPDVAYYSRKVWIDSERFVPLKEELFAKSGQLLKRTTLSDVRQVEGRWFPMTIVYKDMLKQGGGTEFKITGIKFNQKIPEYIFTKAALKQ